jgi:hypothetical protein
MKKLLVLMLVLGMATAASAATITLREQSSGLSSYEYTPGETVTIEVVSGGLTGSGASRIGRLAMSLDTDSDEADSSSAGTLHATLSNNLGWNNGSPAPHPDLITGIVGEAAVGQGVGNVVLYTFDVQVDSMATDTITIGANITLLKNPFGGDLTVDSVTDLVMTPEPMTIALLGLGGLFLRRRR